MPAISADTVLLPRIPAADPQDTERTVKKISTGPRGFEGEGFPVVRAFAGVSMADLDPFVHMDQMGEVDYAPMEPKGTNWHPHRGFETVTYMIDGTFQHQDSHGGGVINNGATQWMTAGSGVLHIETPPEQLVVSGGLFHGLQLWVNLPAKDKFSAPRYQAIEGGDSTLVASADGGSLVRIIAGSIAGHRGPGSTHTPIAVAHASVAPGAQLSLPWDRSYNALVYVLSGDGFAGA
jgi:redox-sensitive bicupin YhaK (pirin superfamily)